MFLRSLGQSMQAAEEQKRREQMLVDERARQDAQWTERFDAQQSAIAERERRRDEASRAEFELRNPVIVPRSGIGAVPGTGGQPLVPNPVGVDLRRQDIGAAGLARLMAGLPLADQPQPERMRDWPGLGPIPEDEWFRMWRDVNGPASGGGQPGLGDSGITTSEALRLQRAMYGNYRQRNDGGVSGAPGAVVPTGAANMLGVDPISEASGDWWSAVESGAIDPYSTAQADSIMGEYVPPMDLASNMGVEGAKKLNLDLWDAGRGVFVNERTIGDEDITVEAARSKIAALIAKSPNKDLTWTAVRNGLRDMGLNDDQIKAVLPKVGSVRPAPVTDEGVLNRLQPEG